MSRFVQRSRLAALGFVAAAVSASPAFADALPLQPADPCALASARAASGCRTAKRHTIVRTAMVEPRGTLALVESRDAFAGSRGFSPLILGVGF